eukprot:CAMPEP_0185576556 /NCGR_PEP_ID=MMETSP0434-20130131/7458_1 /TAXON_ID=626734 ORGANISM="Favella taraikaensis, Strain Fe Narragansett Bay" /NCGR_SAMPLE_ID=MMETSP0434 /ASSEMBLY_ACC=CAM_ASM_000379 /LENGTH=140 /DNA_ID=CAMNT_0028193811 /DNA_START=365 /DNA_END=787 /DNA_ORIENTATION=-
MELLHAHQGGSAPIAIIPLGFDAFETFGLLTDRRKLRLLLSFGLLCDTLLLKFLKFALFALFLALLDEALDGDSEEEEKVHASEQNNDHDVSSADVAASFWRLHEVAEQHQHVQHQQVCALIERLPPYSEGRVERPAPLN